MTTITATGGASITTGNTYAGDVAIPAAPVVDYPAPSAPSLPTTWVPITVGAPMIWTHRESLAAPSLGSDGRPADGWQPTVTEEQWGHFRVVIGGVDVSNLWGVPCVIESYELQEPFGCGPARLRFPQIRPGHIGSLGTGDLAPFVEGKDVDIVRLHPDGTTVTVLWSGVLSKTRVTFGSTQTVSFDCAGDLWISNAQLVHQAPYIDPATDLGTLIANTLNAAISRRHNRASGVAAVTTGITCNRRGSNGQGIVEYVQELLGIFGTVTDGSDTWTVGRTSTPREYEIRLRHTVGSTWTIRPGGRWDGELVRDSETSVNAVYASGIGDKGWAWQNWRYPAGAGNILNALRLALAGRPAVFPRLFDFTTGSDTGPNPLYDPTRIRVEQDVHLGSNIGRGDGYRSTRAWLARQPEPVFTGSLSLRLDPAEGSRFSIRENDKVVLQGMGPSGGDITVRAMRVRVSPPQGDSDPGTVQLDVDQYERDLVTLAGIIDADAESINDPIRMPGRKDRAARLHRDSTIVFDAESPAGYVTNLQVANQTWTRLDVPVSQVGKVAAVILKTSPARAFCVAFFGDLGVLKADMDTLVGDPFATVTDGFGPFDRHAGALEDLGFIQAYGGPGQACGYSRVDSTSRDGYQTSPFDGSSTALTGALYSTATWTYTTTKVPYMRVFFWVTGGSTTFNGRILPAALDL